MVARLIPGHCRAAAALTALAFATLFVPGGDALAHAMLEQADPAAGSTTQAAPKAVKLTFSEELEPRFSGIQVTDGAGHREDQGEARTDPSDAKIFSVDLKPLPPGTYKVKWHATSVDTHKTSGSFTFTVAP